MDTAGVIKVSTHLFMTPVDGGYLSLVADNDVVVHGHWNLVDDELQRGSFHDPHEARTGPGHWATWNHLSHYHFRVLENRINIITTNTIIMWTAFMK